MVAYIRFQGQDRSISLSGAGPWMIGRSPQAAIVIHNDPGTSREQAMIYLEQGRYMLEPLSSRVPTLLDGHPARGRMALTDRSEIRFAEQVLYLLLAGDRTMAIPSPLPTRRPANPDLQLPIRAVQSEFPAIALFFLAVLSLVLPIWQLQSGQTAQLIRLIDTQTIGGIAYLLPIAYALAVAGRALAALRPYALYFDLLGLAGAVLSLIVCTMEAETIVTELASLRKSPLGGFMEFAGKMMGMSLEAKLAPGNGLYLLGLLILGSALLTLQEMIKRSRPARPS